MKSLSSPFNLSIRKAMKEALCKDGREVYADYIDLISQRYNILSPHSNSFDQNIKHIDDNGTANLLPKWSEDGQKIAYISNQNHEYFGSTEL